MSFWSKINSKKINKFIKKYKNKPGILAIHNIKNETILVFYDENKIEEDIPGEYEDIEVDNFNIRYVLANAKLMKKKYADCEQEPKIAEFLDNAITLSQKLLATS
jgi:CRISPR/Cas system CSM-associated protein Csm2 small subunit